ncbi:MAG: hypothetical protein IH944_02775 [Armatimonadetes bacterium]|nr:hypothetical protein [Armatimonadota bacterium]
MLGIGYGFKEKKGKSTGELAIVVFVKRKKSPRSLDPKERIPSKFDGVKTDVVELGKREQEGHDDSDMMFVDFAKIHRENLPNIKKAKTRNPPKHTDFGNLAVVVDDGALVIGGNIDYIHAFEIFRDTHPDVYDFLIFFSDTASGMPFTGSFHSAIFNATSGINYYAGSSFNIRAAWGTNKLLAFNVISTGAWSWPGNMRTILQEVGHYWSAFERFKKYAAETTAHFDLLLGSSGQGLYHWGRYFDNAHSPVDYDGVDWTQAGSNEFTMHPIDNDDFYYCNLDLYNMGLLAPNEVGPLRIIKNPQPLGAPTVYGSLEEISVQNIIWEHGPRNPDHTAAQRLFKTAFIILTKDVDSAAANVVPVLDDVRRELTWQYHKATGFRGKLDTTISPELKTFVLR